MLSVRHSEALNAVIGSAKAMARHHHHAHYGAAHLFSAVMESTTGLPAMLQAWDKDPEYVSAWAEMRLETYPRANHPIDFVLGDDVSERVFEEAEKVRLRLGMDEIAPICLFVALITPGVAWSIAQLKTLPITDQEAMRTIADRGFASPENDSAESLPEFSSPGQAPQKIPYVHRINDVFSDQGRHTIGRDREIRQMNEALHRLFNTGVLIVGDAGVGKSALLKAFIHFREHAEDIDLGTAQYYRLDTARLVMGCAHGGEIENRLTKVLDQLRKLPEPLLIIDDLHVLLEDKGGSNKVSYVLDAALSEGSVAIVATTVTESYTKKIESNEALVRRLEVISLSETDEATTRKCLEVHRVTLEKHNDLHISEDALRDAARLARRYFKDRRLPDAAITLLDRTCTAAVQANARSQTECAGLQSELDQLERELHRGMERNHALAELKWLLGQMQNRLSPVLLGQMTNQTDPAELTEPDALLSYLKEAIQELSELAQDPTGTISPTEVAAMVAYHTGIPIGKIQSKERDKLLNLQEHLKRRVVGQDHAVQVLSDAIVESRSGLGMHNKPIGSFFFLGPTGTGKTELAKTLAEFLFNDEQAMIRFDMSEFKEEHSAALLYGAPPGYVGYEEGGLLVNKIRQRPYSVVLFDEIEKAHDSVYDIFLQIMDEGHVHDRLGKKGSFVDAIVIFTSNLGSEWIAQKFREGKTPVSGELMEILTRNFRPEFLGRLTEVVPFGPITEEVMPLIFDIQLKKLDHVLRYQGLELSVSAGARQKLALAGYSERYGARPVQSVIRKQIRRPISKMLVKDEVRRGDALHLDLDADGQPTWNTQASEAEK
jgi:ATP-dependent Clp protease ATP-binding subunit ClpB